MLDSCGRSYQNGSMRIALDIVEDDVRAWMRHILDSDGQTQKAQRAIRLITPVLLLLLGILTAGWIGGLIFGFVGLLMSLFYVPWALRSQFKRRIDTEVAALPDGMIGHHTIELTDTSIEWKTSAVTATWQRSAIRQVAETDTHAFVMFSKSSAFIVPLYPDDDGARRALLDDIKLNRMPPAS